MRRSLVANFDRLLTFSGHVWAFGLGGGRRWLPGQSRRPFVCSRIVCVAIHRRERRAADLDAERPRGTTQFAAVLLQPCRRRWCTRRRFVCDAAVLGRGARGCARISPGRGATTLRGSAAIARRPGAPMHLHRRFSVGGPVSRLLLLNGGPLSPRLPLRMARQPSPLPWQQSGRGPQSGRIKTRNKYGSR